MGKKENSNSLWTVEQVQKIFSKPFMDLLYQAHSVHRKNFNPNVIQISTLLSIKSGKCPENCSYCSQSVHHSTGIESSDLMNVEEVIKAAKLAKSKGATRFCMGAAYRGPKDRDVERIIPMIREVKKLGLETCVTLGILTKTQAKALKKAGLDYYNHNIDTSKEYYSHVITTRTFNDRLKTLQNVVDAGLRVCSGGILGLGESSEDRLSMLATLANMNPVPNSIPINQLVPISGTPLEKQSPPDPFDFIRIIAVARVLMPTSHIRLAAGRSFMNDEMQALSFFAGVNSIFYGENLLTTKNTHPHKDERLFKRLNLMYETLPGE